MDSPPAWTDINAIHFRFQKHCNPAYRYVHELLNWTYSQLIQDENLDDIFLDGSSRTTIRSDVIQALKVKIIELSSPCASLTTNKLLVQEYMIGMPMRARTSNGITLLCNASSVEAVLRDVRDNKPDGCVVVYLDIDAFYFRPETNDGQYFNPKRFEDISTTRFAYSRLPSAALSEHHSETNRRFSGPVARTKFRRRRLRWQQLPSSSDHTADS